MGILLALAPTAVSLAILGVLFPVNPILAFVIAVGVWFGLSLWIWGGGGGTGDDRYDAAGGPFDVD